MKKLLFLLLFCPILTFAQLTDSTWAEKQIHQQLGVNATAFIKQFLSFNNTVFTNPQQFQNPFFIQYKLFYSNRQNLLIGTRFGFGLSETQNNFSGGSNRTSVTSDISYRLGFEFQQKITRRWIIFYGADFVSSKFKDVTTNTFTNISGPIKTTTVSQLSRMGGGPVFGAQFHINKRLSLSTETAFYFLEGYTEVNSTREPPLPGTLPQPQKDYLKSMGFVSPAFINFNINF